MPIDHLDPFATTGSLGPDEENPERITGGRYRLPDLTKMYDADGWVLETGTGPRKGGWQRVTTLVKAIGDARALDLWHQRLLIVGMVKAPWLYDLACSTLATTPEGPELKAALEDLANRILGAAGAEEGAALGTAFHGFTEAQDLGMLHYARKKWHGKLMNYRTGLEVMGLEVLPALIERRVVILRYGLCGTVDRFLWDRRAEVYRVGDLKSQKTFWTWMEIAAQLAAYASADAMWDRESLSYVEVPPGGIAQDLGVVAWMPVDGNPEDPRRQRTSAEDRDGVDFFDVDLEKGRAALDLAYRADRMRSEAKSRMQTWGLLRPAPELTRVEMYARRLDSVSSPAEGSALWAEITAAGLGQEGELSSLAAEVAQRFTPATS